MKKYLVLFFLLSMIIPVFSQSGFIINHTHTNLSTIPDNWVDSAQKNLKIRYFRRSHGSQLDTGGMNAVRSFSPAYASKFAYSKTGGNGTLMLSPYWVSLDFENSTWVQITRDYLDDPENSATNVVMWAWSSNFYLCSPQQYLNDMEMLIAEYGPNGTKIQSGIRTVPVTFVFHTACGHYGITRNPLIYSGNQLIRAHCATNNRILFDFNDFERWDPDGHFYGDNNPDESYTTLRMLNDDLAYKSDSTNTSVMNGFGNWGIEWMNRNPNAELSRMAADNNCVSCDHSRGVYQSETKDNSRIHCVLKGRAAWWLWARMAGWNPDNKSVSATPNTALTEANLNNSNIVIRLTGETFADNVLSNSNFILNNAPSGVTINTVIYNNNSQATISLLYNGTDFDSNITNFNISISEAELSGTANLSSNNMTITSIAERLQISTTPAMSEANLNNKQITLVLTDITFLNSSLSAANFRLNNAPVGVTVSSVTYVNTTQATVNLAFNGTDFDNNITNFNITILGTELARNSNLTSNNLPITALVEGLQISTDPALTERNLNNKQVTLTLNGDNFTDNSLALANFRLNNSPIGLSILSVAYVNNQQATVTLRYTGTDFDTDISNFSISILEAEINGTVNLTSNFLLIDAYIERAQLLAIPQCDEVNIKQRTLDLTLTDDAFLDNQVHWVNVLLNNAPYGLEVDSVKTSDSQHAQIFVKYDGNDFDANIPNFNMTIVGSELVSRTHVVSNNLPIIAKNERVAITNAEEIREMSLDGKVIYLQLTDDEFLNKSLPILNFSLEGAPNGLLIKRVSITSKTTAELILSYFGTDFNTDSINFSVIVNQSILLSGRELKSNKRIIFADMISGIDDFADNKDIMLFPNPNNGFFRLNLKKQFTETAQLKIFNASGQTVDIKTLIKGQKYYDFNYSVLPKGQYYLCINYEDSDFTKVFIVE